MFGLHNVFRLIVSNQSLHPAHGSVQRYVNPVLLVFFVINDSASTWREIFTFKGKSAPRGEEKGQSSLRENNDK